MNLRQDSAHFFAGLTGQRHDTITRLTIVKESSGNPSSLANACRQFALAIEFDSYRYHHILTVPAELGDASLASCIAVMCRILLGVMVLAAMVLPLKCGCRVYCIRLAVTKMR